MEDRSLKDLVEASKCPTNEEKRRLARSVQEYISFIELMASQLRSSRDRPGVAALVASINASLLALMNRKPLSVEGLDPEVVQLLSQADAAGARDVKTMLVSLLKEVSSHEKETRELEQLDVADFLLAVVKLLKEEWGRYDAGQENLKKAEDFHECKMEDEQYFVADVRAEFPSAGIAMRVVDRLGEENGMGEEKFKCIVEMVNHALFDGEKLEVVQKKVKENLSLDQLRSLLGLFLYDDGKVLAALDLRPFVKIDDDAFATIASECCFSKQEARDRILRNESSGTKEKKIKKGWFS